jgi:hypothetical protein
MTKMPDRRARRSLIAVPLGLLLALASPGPATRGADPTDAPDPLAAPRIRDIVYRPPWPDAPKRRIDGPARGSRDHELSLRALAPETVGLTTAAQPSLYWFNPAAIPYPVMVVLAEEGRPAPLLEVRFADGLTPGIHGLALADHGVALAVGIEYRWSVEVIIDPAHPSRDLVASGTILRIQTPTAVAGALAAAPKGEQPHVFAENGLWYEALDALSRMIRSEPDNPVWRHLRASLLEQVALPEAAAHDQGRH